MQIKPNKDGSKLEQAYFWLFKSMELEAAHVRAPDKIKPELADKALEMALLLEQAHFAEPEFLRPEEPNVEI